MAKKKPETPEVEQDTAPELPAKVTLEQNFTFWHRPHHNAEITMQFYAGQVVSDAQLIALLIANNAPLKDNP